MQYKKEYSIEWEEECEADNFEEAEKILDEQAGKNHPSEDIIKSGEVEQCN